MENNFNILLDPLPEEWQGYQIDSDFQTGIQIFWILDDNDLSNWEKLAQCREFLFTEEAPETADEIWAAVTWFLNGWNTDNLPRGKAEAPVMSYQKDQWRIWVAFRRQYGIDLNMEKVHFWCFMALLRNLDECSFTRVVDIRGKKITGKMSKEERKWYREMKSMYDLEESHVKREYTEEEVAKIDAFDEMKKKIAARKAAAKAFQEMTK